MVNSQDKVHIIEEDKEHHEINTIKEKNHCMLNEDHLAQKDDGEIKMSQFNIEFQNLVSEYLCM